MTMNLSEEQLRYAANDVRYLHRAHSPRALNREHVIL
jgi:ribonuclease D